mmetsp:Transcript_25348/g.68866  ORF Transcript_25348/g.68866 Transcript_25348/m.68866 type:complete len:370 (-) Transcript_25348:415-1524(-)
MTPRNRAGVVISPEHKTSSQDREDDGYVSSKARGATLVSKGWRHDRYRPHLGCVVLAIFLAPLCPWTPPAWLSKLLMLAGVSGLAYKVVKFPRWNDENKYVLRFLACFCAMLVELIWENGMVWLCSATDIHKHERMEPLQDNVEIGMNMLGKQNALIHWLNHLRWANILHFLGAILALAFSVVWEQMPYSGFGLFARVALTICFSRIIRVAAFMCTILPNPKPGCYLRRFPPLPPTTWEIIKAGYTTIRGFGGCNDLIISGHGAFWTLAPLALQTYYQKYRWVGAFLWVALAHTSLRDVIDKQHYSVDMLLAVVVTYAVWNALDWVYPASQPLPARPPGSPPDKPHPLVLGLIAFALTAAGIIVIGGNC